MSESRVRENRTHGSMRRREATPDQSALGRTARGRLPPTLRRSGDGARQPRRLRERTVAPNDERLRERRVSRRVPSGHHLALDRWWPACVAVSGCGLVSGIQPADQLANHRRTAERRQARIVGDDLDSRRLPEPIARRTSPRPLALRLRLHRQGALPNRLQDPPKRTLPSRPDGSRDPSDNSYSGIRV
jgi:hypothetical protein